MAKNIIKKTFLSAVAAALCGMSSAEENPVMRLFPADIRFYCSFDDGEASAEMAGGDAVPKASKENPTFGRGLFKQGLRSGRIFFNAPGNVNLASSGTMVCWVSPENWPVADNGAGEAGFTMFGAWSRNNAQALYTGKMGGQKWGRSHLNAYLQYPKPRKHSNCIIWDNGNANQWKNGEWHMLAVTWDPNGFGYSLDGRKFSYTILETPITDPTESFFVGVGEKFADSWQLIVDEFVILGRAATNDELERLYRETVAAANLKQ